jgi:hypothetical protein
MDSKRELELQFQVAARDGDIVALTRCMDAGVDIECTATDVELDEYIESLNVDNNNDQDNNNNDQDKNDNDQDNNHQDQDNNDY